MQSFRFWDVSPILSVFKCIAINLLDKTHLMWCWIYFFFLIISQILLGVVFKGVYVKTPPRHTRTTSWVATSRQRKEQKQHYANVIHFTITISLMFLPSHNKLSHLFLIVIIHLSSGSVPMAMYDQGVIVRVSIKTNIDSFLPSKFTTKIPIKIMKIIVL